MTGAEFKALIPDNAPCVWVGTCPVEAGDVVVDKDGDIMIAAFEDDEDEIEGEESEDEEFDDEDDEDEDDE